MAMWTPYAGCWTGLDCIMEDNLWAVDFILTLPNTCLEFFVGETEENGHWKPAGLFPRQ